jgi:hypothetical protein
MLNEKLFGFKRQTCPLESDHLALSHRFLVVPKNPLQNSIFRGMLPDLFLICFRCEKQNYKISNPNNASKSVIKLQFGLPPPKFT